MLKEALEYLVNLAKPVVHNIGARTFMVEPEGNYMDLEAFRIMLLSSFMPTDDLAEVLSIAANFREDEEMAVVDTGITQRVTVKTGVLDVAHVALKPMYELRPFRTFQEVEQPPSNFIFRLRKGGQAALFEADGGAWKYAARENVGSWLRSAMHAGPVDLSTGEAWPPEMNIPVLV